MRLKGVFLGGEQNHVPGTCSPRCPAKQSLVKKAERTSYSLLWGSEQMLSHSFEQGDFMYWQAWSFPSLVFCKGHAGGSPTPERRAASSFSLGYRKSMETVLMCFLKAGTLFMSWSFFWGRLTAYKCSLGKSQYRGQCSGCLWVEHQVK